MKKKTWDNKILNDPTFRKLYRQKKTISFVLTLFIVGIYIVYILIDAFDREFLAYKASGGITLGIILGIGIIIIGWIATGIYVWWANKKYDLLLEKIKRMTGGQL